MIPTDAIADIQPLYGQLGREYMGRLAAEREAENLRAIWTSAVKALAGIKSGKITLEQLEVFEDGFKVHPPKSKDNITDLRPPAAERDA